MRLAEYDSLMDMRNGTGDKFADYIYFIKENRYETRLH